MAHDGLVCPPSNFGVADIDGADVHRQYKLDEKPYFVAGFSWKAISGLRRSQARHLLQRLRALAGPLRRR
jgi:hypothetical protein